MPLWRVNVSFNVEAATQQEAALKVSSLVSADLPGKFDEISVPVLQVGKNPDDCDTGLR